MSTEVSSYALHMRTEVIGYAQRVTMHQAKREFLAGAVVIVSERGHETEQTVTRSTTTHHRDRTDWDELVGQVRMWRNRYPNQRFYVLSRCIVPDVLRGVRMHHSENLLEVHHGNPSGPLVACGFHWTFYQYECLEQVRNATEVIA